MSRSRRASTASVTSTGETALRRINDVSSSAESQTRSVDAIRGPGSRARSCRPALGKLRSDEARARRHPRRTWVYVEGCRLAEQYGEANRPSARGDQDGSHAANCIICLMDRALCDRLAACLDRPEILAIDPERIARAPRRARRGRSPASAGRGGAVTGYDPGPGRRRLVTIDRRGHLTAACRWRADGTLAWAKCLTGNGDWIGIEPAADDHPAWGLSDRLWLLDRAGGVGAARGAHALSGPRLRAAGRASRRSSRRLGCRPARAPPSST